ncbi:MAG TPA: HAMP domain-containing sensor histidine kinase [Acidimicrobiales bacterium]|nr:HAMP domain-containing sensor histidine kinase [Acidimicrobiales bacterium]
MAETAPAGRRLLVVARPSDATLVRTGVVVAAALFLAYVATPSSWVVVPDLILFPLAGTFSVWCVVVGVRHHRPAVPRAWLLIGLGLAAFTVGYVTTGIYEVTIGHDPFPSASDVFYLAGYPLLLAGLVVAVRVRQSAGLDPWAGIDAVILGSVAALIAWLYLVGPALGSDQLSYTAGLATMCYVVGDVLLFGGTVRFLMVTTWRGQWAVGALALGFAATFVGDVGYTSWTIRGAPPEVLWAAAQFLGLLASGVAALHPTMRALTEEEADPALPAGGRRLVLIAAAGLIPPVLLAVRYAQGESLYIGANTAVWVTVTILTALRFRRAARIAEDEAVREATLSRYAADMLAAGDRDEIMAIACRALTGLSGTGEGQALLVPAGGPELAPAPAPLVRTTTPVVVRDETAATIVATGTRSCVRRWRPSLGAIANQLALALERDRLLETERETAESLAEQNERLRELDAMKDRFVSSVTHELRTPLTSMLGFLEMMREGEVGDLTDDQAHAVEVIDRNGHRLERLVSDILVAARFDSGRMRFDMGPVDLPAVVAGQVESISAVAAAGRTEVRLVTDGDLPAVWGDEVRLGQVVDNLLSNAVKFAPGGIVTATVTRREGQAELTVADTGVGMPPEDLDKVFDRFYRASTAGATVGTGLGLSIARSIVEAHGGTIGVTSELGEGTTFRVELPLDAGDATGDRDRDEVTA